MSDAISTEAAKAEVVVPIKEKETLKDEVDINTINILVQADYY